jgi:hypothetical protein
MQASEAAAGTTIRLSHAADHPCASGMTCERIHSSWQVPGGSLDRVFIRSDIATRCDSISFQIDLFTVIVAAEKE